MARITEVLGEQGVGGSGASQDRLEEVMASADSDEKIED